MNGMFRWVLLATACATHDPSVADPRVSEAAVARIEAQAWSGTVDAALRSVDDAVRHPEDPAREARALADLERVLRGIQEGQAGDPAELVLAARPVLERVIARRRACPALSAVAEIHALSGAEETGFQLHQRAAVECNAGASAIRRTQLARALRRCDDAIDWVAQHFALFTADEGLVVLGELLECGSPALLRQRMPFLSDERIREVQTSREAAEAARAARCGARCATSQRACQDYCVERDGGACVAACADAALVCRAGCGL